MKTYPRSIKLTEEELRRLEQIALDRSKPGGRIYLHTILKEAITNYLNEKESA